MSNFTYGLPRAIGGARNASIGIHIMLWAQLALYLPASSAQRPSIVTSLRHASTVKAVASLDWIGLYEPPEIYGRWWKETAACAQIPLPPSRPDSVQFYFVNAPDFLPGPTDKPDHMMAAVTYAGSEEIFISVLLLRNETVVKHEMLHQLLYWWGEPDWHDDGHSEFKRCGLAIV